MNDQLSNDEITRMMGAISVVTALTPTAVGLVTKLADQAKQNDYDCPSTYGALANALCTISDAMDVLDDVTSDFSVSDPLVNGEGNSLAVELSVAAEIIFGAAGLMAYALDRSLIPEAARHALNEASIVLAEPLPLPDDATDDQQARSAINIAYAESAKMRLSSVIQGRDGEDHVH